MKRLWAIVAAAILVASARAEGPAATQWSKLPRLKEGKVVTLPFGRIRIAKETTRITEPLAEDGTVDYLAAINQYCGKGVTAENNAFVRLLDALGPDALPRQTLGKQLELLGVKEVPPGDGTYIMGFEAWVEKRTGEKTRYDVPSPTDGLFERVWSSKEQPKVAAWLKEMDGPLKIATEASRRPRYYIGYAVAGKDSMVIAILLPSLGSIRGAVNACCMRAMLRLGDGDEAGALEDIRTAMRLGRLMAQSATMIERLVGIASEAVALRACRAAVASGKVSAEGRDKMLAELLALPDIPDVAEAVDQYERYAFLDAMVMIARGRSASLMNLMGQNNDLKGNLLLGYDRTMMAANGWYDWMIDASRKKTLAERQAAFKEYNEAAQRLGELYASPVASAFNMGEKLITIFLPDFSRAFALAEAGRMDKELTVVALALHAYKAKHGAYPETLAALEGGILKKVPLDRFTEKPLRYERQGDGYLLYSVGTNGIDDGGVRGEKGKDDLVAKAAK